MKTELTMPKLRPEMEKGVLVAWLKEAGEGFAKGEPIFEIETDKVVNQIEADEAGTLVSLYVEEGDEISVGDAIAEVELA